MDATTWFVLRKVEIHMILMQSQQRKEAWLLDTLPELFVHCSHGLYGAITATACKDSHKHPDDLPQSGFKVLCVVRFCEKAPRNVKLAE